MLCVRVFVAKICHFRQDVQDVRKDILTGLKRRSGGGLRGVYENFRTRSKNRSWSGSNVVVAGVSDPTDQDLRCFSYLKY